MQDKNRMFLLSGMFIFFIIFIIFVFFYEKENKVMDVNTYYLPYKISKEFEKEIGDYLILGIIKNEEEHKRFMEVYDIYEDDAYLNYDYNYVHVAIKYDACSEDIKFSKIKKNDDKYDLIFKDRLSCGSVCGNEFVVFEIPIDKEVVDISKLNVVIKYDDSNQVNCVDDDIVVKKPILYLYPEKEMMVNVKFEHEENLLSTYPKYKNSWNVLAKKDGTLIDNSGREYYALYWDEKLKHEENFETGFFVKSENSIEFLENKLSEMGLTDREANEFIMFWLPIMEQGGDNLVHFHFTDDRQMQNKIYIEPAVDSLFRISIEIKKTDKEIKIKEQNIEKFERYGFSALEWGGTIIK